MPLRRTKEKKRIYNKFEELGINLCTSPEVAELKVQMDKIKANNPDINFGEIGLNELSKLDPKLDTVLFQELRDLHYTKNLINREQFTLQKLVKSDYKINGVTLKKMPWYASFYHMIGLKNIGNTKYVSEDGRFEVVFNKKGEMVSSNIDAKNMGTYNFAPSMVQDEEEKKRHTPCDVKPYEILGNAKGVLGKMGVIEKVSLGTNVLMTMINPIEWMKHSYRVSINKEYSYKEF